VRLPKKALALVASPMILLAACGSDDKGSESTTTAAVTTVAPATTTAPAETTAPAAATTTIPPRGDADLVFWLDETRAKALKPVIDKFAADNGVKTQIVEVANDQMRNAVTQAAPKGEGPDIFAGAHDWVGELVQNGIVAPVELGADSSKYGAAALQGFTINSKLYGLPYATENVALFTNTALVPTPPATMDELIKDFTDLKAAGKVDLGIATQQADGGAPYHNEALFTASGGYIFGQDANGNWDPTDVGIASPGGLEAATNFQQWFKDGVMSFDTSYDVMIEKFATGKAPFMIVGPWAIPGVKEKAPDLKYTIGVIPTVGGDVAKPFLGVQGFYQSAFAKNPGLAATFLTDYVNTPETMKALYDAQPRPPAMTSVYDEVKSDPVIQGFGAAGAEAQALPNIPQMSAVWAPFQNGYQAVSAAGSSAPAQDAFKATQAEIEAAIAKG
jgi:arabinogalactan oligomer / maltooligosaccharide transport system substrate-binding protein